MSRLLLFAALATLSFACNGQEGTESGPTATPTPAPPASVTPAEGVTGPGGKIAFVSERDGNAEIYVIGTDGSDLTNVSQDPARDEMPAWSPDGTRIAFASDRGEFFEIYIMDSGGGTVTKIQGSHANNFAPVWAADGARIAFQCGNQLCIVDVEGNPIDTFDETASITGALVGSWSVDGRIAYFWGLTGARGAGGIRVVNEDGSDDEELLAGEPQSGIYYGEPAWSPDGQRLAFSSNWDGNFEVYSREPDGTLTRLTDDPAIDGHPAWSSDGKWIVFASDRAGNLDLYVMRADGGGVRQLTDHEAADRAPVWSP